MPTGSSNKKTIQINHDFFKIGKKGLNAVSNKQTQKAEKKPRNKTVKHNTIKRELIKRIQQLKQQEKKDKSNEHTDDLQDNAQKSEFDDSMKYLQSLANQRKSEKKKLRKQEKDKKREQSNENNPSGGGISPKNKTMKSSLLYQQYGLDVKADVDVNVDLPSELRVTIPPTSYPIDHHKIDTTPPMKLDNYRNTPVKHENTNTNTNTISPIKRVVAPPYSNLKGSTSKPSFREWNRTKKNRSRGSSNVSNRDPPQSSTIATLNERERTLEKVKNKFRENSKKVPSNISTHDEILELKRFYTKNKQGGNSRSRRKTIKKTIKQSYTVGKSRDKKKISVLVKNMKTRKRVQEAKKKLKTEDLSEIKRILKERGLLKSGSSAPNDVIRTMYESAMLAGDVHNLNVGTKIHNYLEEDDSF